MSIKIEKQLGDGRKVFEVYTKQEVDEILTQTQRLTQRAQKILSGGGGGASGDSWLATDGNNLTNITLGSSLLFSGGNNINVTVSNGQVTIDSTTSFELGDLENVTPSVDSLDISDDGKALVWNASVGSWNEDDVVNSFNTRTGDVMPASGDYTFSDLTGSIADGQVPESAVTQHASAMSWIATDGSTLINVNLTDSLLFKGGNDIVVTSDGVGTLTFDSTASFSLGDLTNVASAVDGLGVGDNRDVLYWDGSTWVNSALDALDIQTGTFADARIALSNVTQHGDGRYGQLASTNTWTQVNTFNQYLAISTDGRIQGDAGGAVEVLASDGTNTGIMRVDRMIVNDLEVQGSIDNTNTNELHVEDQFISINSGQIGTPTLDGGLYAERGDLADAYWFWDEGNDDWGKKLGGLGTFDKAIFDSDIGSLVQAWNSDLDTYVANPLTSGELTQLQNINLATISSTQWSYLATLDQNVSTTSNVTFGEITGNGSTLFDIGTGEFRIQNGGAIFVADGSTGQIALGSEPINDVGLLLDTPARAITANTDYSRMLIASGGTLTVTASTTSPLVATVRFEEPNINLASGATVTNATTVYIEGAPTEGDNNYALYAPSGRSLVDNLTVQGTINLNGTELDNVDLSNFNTAYTERIDTVTYNSGTHVITFSRPNHPSGDINHDLTQALGELAGVTLGTLTNNEALVYSGVSGFWENQPIVNSFDGRTGVVVPQSGDYDFTLIGGTIADAQVPESAVTQHETAMSWIATDGSTLINVNLTDSLLFKGGNDIVVTSDGVGTLTFDSTASFSLGELGGVSATVDSLGAGDNGKALIWNGSTWIEGNNLNSLDIGGSAFVDSSRNVTGRDGFFTRDGIASSRILGLDSIGVLFESSTDHDVIIRRNFLEKLRATSSGVEITGNLDISSKVTAQGTIRGESTGSGSRMQLVSTGTDAIVNMEWENDAQRWFAGVRGTDGDAWGLNDGAGTRFKVYPTSGNAELDGTLTINSQLLFDLGQEQNLGKNQSPTFADATINGTLFSTHSHTLAGDVTGDIGSTTLASNVVSANELANGAITAQTDLVSLESVDEFLVFDNSALGLKRIDLSVLEGYMNSNLNFTTSLPWGDITGKPFDDLSSQFTTVGTAPNRALTILNYNDTNWDTAYSWGDHSTVGYITGNETITISGDAGGSGATSISITLNNSAITGKTDLASLASDDEFLIFDASALSLKKTDLADLQVYLNNNLTFSNVDSLGDLSNVSATVDGLGAGDNRDVLYWTGSTWDNIALSTADIQSGTFADARIAQSNVTQHEGAITITESQISDFGNYDDYSSWTASDGTDFGVVASTDTVQFTGSGGIGVTVTDGNPIVVDIDGSTAGGVETLGDLTNVSISVDSLDLGDNGDVLTWDGSTWTNDVPFVPDSGGTFSGDLILDGGASNVRIEGHDAGSWTGNLTADSGIGKIEYHADAWYIVSSDSAGDIVKFRNSASSNVVRIANNGDVTATDFIATSDARIKSNETPITNALESLRSITPYHFDKDGERKVGYIAQNVEEFTENVVTQIEKDGYTDFRVMNMFGMQAYNTMAIKELDTKVDDEVTQLKNRVQELEEEVRQLGGSL